MSSGTQKASSTFLYPFSIQMLEIEGQCLKFRITKGSQFLVQNYREKEQFYAVFQEVYTDFQAKWEKDEQKASDKRPKNWVLVLSKCLGVENQEFGTNTGEPFKCHMFSTDIYEKWSMNKQRKKSAK